MREKKQNNIKRFMDEKKVLKFLTSPKSCSQTVFSASQTATIKQNREKEKLKVTHDKQLEELDNDVQKVQNAYREIVTLETVV